MRWKQLPRPGNLSPVIPSTRMGPSLANSLHVATGIGVDTPLRSARQQRVPFNLLSRNFQLMHQRGIQILSVRAQGADTATAEVQPTPWQRPQARPKKRPSGDAGARSDALGASFKHAISWAALFQTLPVDGLQESRAINGFHHIHPPTALLKR